MQKNGSPPGNFLCMFRELLTGQGQEEKKPVNMCYKKIFYCNLLNGYVVIDFSFAKKLRYEKVFSFYQRYHSF